MITKIRIKLSWLKGSFFDFVYICSDVRTKEWLNYYGKEHGVVYEILNDILPRVVYSA